MDISESDIDAWFAVEHDTVLSGVAKQDLYKALREIRRHRAAVAADKERIGAVVLAVWREDWSEFLPYPGAVALATRAAEQLATAAMAPGVAVAAVERLRAEWAAPSIMEREWPGANFVDDLDSLLATATAAPSPPTTDRITAGLAKLGAEHEPPAGWEQRVMDAAESEASLNSGWGYSDSTLGLSELQKSIDAYDFGVENVDGRLREALDVLMDVAQTALELSAARREYLDSGFIGDANPLCAVVLEANKAHLAALAKVRL